MMLKRQNRPCFHTKVPESGFLICCAVGLRICACGARREAKKEEKRTKLHINELLGKISSMKEDISAFSQQISSEIRGLTDFERFCNTKRNGKQYAEEIKKIKVRVKAETGKEDCKVLRLNSDSSLAKKI